MVIEVDTTLLAALIGGVLTICSTFLYLEEKDRRELRDKKRKLLKNKSALQRIETLITYDIAVDAERFFQEMQDLEKIKEQLILYIIPLAWSGMLPDLVEEVYDDLSEFYKNVVRYSLIFGTYVFIILEWFQIFELFVNIGVAILAFFSSVTAFILLFSDRYKDFIKNKYELIEELFEKTKNIDIQELKTLKRPPSLELQKLIHNVNEILKQIFQEKMRELIEEFEEE